MTCLVASYQIPKLLCFRRRSFLLFAAIAFLLGGLLCNAETPETSWVSRYGRLVDSDDDWAAKVVADTDGNVIVAGFIDEKFTGRDILLVKYSSMGVPSWTNRFNRPGNGDDEATAMAVNGSGIIYVTGSSLGAFVTMAISSSGISLWTNYYAGYTPTALALDVAGNVIVTGPSSGANSGYDYATIKYSGDGVPLWTNRYDGPAGSTDFATDLALSTNGSVFVTGWSIGNGSSWDYATVAYSSAGAAMWTNRYNGAGNGNDRPNAIAVGNNGNVLVTGYSAGVGSSYDYVTISYLNSGVGLWTNRYDGSGNGHDEAVAVAIDASGNVFVTGTSFVSHGSDTNNDYATIKYSVEGLTLWINRFNGPANFSEDVSGFVLDTVGNVLVTGYSTSPSSFFDYATIKYSNSGAVLWTNYFGGPSSATDQANDLAVDGAGNVSVTGVSYSSGMPRHWATVSYASSGLVRWTNYFGGRANSYDVATAVAVDGSGSVFVSGDSAGFATTIKYLGGGVALWTNFYAGMKPTAMACDKGGNVFLTGYASGPTGNDYLTVAYSGAGGITWVNRYDGPAGSDDRARTVAVDVKGNVFVSGYSSRIGGLSYDYATLAYSAEGIPLWTNRYDSPSHGADYATAMVADIAGNVFVTGYSPGTNSFDDYTTIAYSSTGIPLWTNRYDGPANSYDQASEVAVDTAGHVFVTGKSIGIGSYYDYATVAYSSIGIPLWTNRYSYSGPWNSEDSPAAVAVDDDGNLIVTGASPRDTYSYDDYDYATIKYSGSGVPLWTNRCGPGVATAVAVDRDGNVFVTGTGPNYYHDYVTVKYSAAGLPLWTNRYNGPADGYDQPGSQCIAIGPDGAVFVTGTSDGNYSAQETPDFATVKYVSLPEIAFQPRDQTNSTGATVAFAVGATGSAPLRYQWQRTGTNLFNSGNVSGANNDTLTLAHVQRDDVGGYSVVITNAFGSVTSTVALLNVVELSSINLSAATLTDRVFHLSFTNTLGATFTVVTTTNLNLPLSNWTILGSVTEGPAGQFQFSDFQLRNSPQRFYRVRSP